MKYSFLKHFKFFVTTFIAIYGALWLILETSDYFGTASLKNAGWGTHIFIIILVMLVSIIASYVYFAFIQKGSIVITQADKYPELVDFRETFRNINWPGLIENSNESIDIVVYYFDSWVNQNNEAITNYLSKPKTRIRVFVANPDDPFVMENVRRLFNEYNVDTVKEKVSHTNERFLEIFQKIGADKGRFEFYYYPYLLNYSLQVFDGSTAVFSVFEMYRKTKIDSPAFVIDLKKSTHLRDYVRKEIAGILKESQKIV